MRTGWVHKSALERRGKENEQYWAWKPVPKTGRVFEQQERVLSRHNVEVFPTETGVRLVIGPKPKRKVLGDKDGVKKPEMRSFHGKGEVEAGSSLAKTSLIKIHLPGLSFSSFGSLSPFIKLREIDLSFNRIVDFLDMKLPPGLRKVKLRGNFIREIYKTQASDINGPCLKLVCPFFEAKRLESIDLALNFIEEIPEQFFRLIPEIKNADFSYNCIEEMPSLTEFQEDKISFSL